MQKVFVFVFARGGSKGLPRKNVLPLGGIPLLAHSIEVAKQLDCVAKIFVSTDDDEIKTIAREFDAEVIDRPDALARDDAPEIKAWKHAVSFLRDKGEEFDVFVSLPATSPLRDQSDVRACLEALDEETDVVITVRQASRSPYFNMVSRDNDGRVKVLSELGSCSRRQDVPEVFDVSAVAYITRPEFIDKHNRLFDGKVKSIIVPKERALDIDDFFDYKFAEVLIEAKRSVAER